MSLLRRAILLRSVSRLFSQFAGNESGSIAQMFALASIPLMAATGAVVDYNRIAQAEVTLQDLADRAALVGAALAGSESEKEQAAENFLDGNPVELMGVSYGAEFEADDTTDTVKVTMEAEVAGTLVTAAFAMNKSNRNSTGERVIIAKAKALDEGGEDLCMVTLNEHADNAMYFRGTGNISATDCGFHSDSSSTQQAIHLQGSAVANADFFHAVGGWKQTGASGSFSEVPEGGKNVKGNPFTHNPTCPSGSYGTWNPRGSSSSPTTTTTTTFSDISPASNGWGRLPSGTVYVSGTISLQNNRNLIGSSTTIVLCGPNAKIDMNGGNLQLQAPTTGAYAGFSVIGNSTATSTSTLTGGPSTWVRGTWYTPESKLYINGNAEFNANSKYFPIVADQVEIGGTGSINLEMDWAEYGYAQPTELQTEEERLVWLVD